MVLRQAKNSYSIWRFNIILIHVDIQFKAIKDQKTLDVNVNVVSKGKHVPEIECVIWVFKEHGRCYYSMLTQLGITTLPKIMVIHLMITVCFHICPIVEG